MKYEDRIIKIFTTEYTIKFVDKIETDNEEDFCFGITKSTEFIIEIATKDGRGNQLKDSFIQSVLIHEIIHAILIEGQYLNQSDDEPLVEWLAKCLTSLKQQEVI